MTRTYWLSFCDSDRPTGQQFLGVVVIDVTKADVDAAAGFLAKRRAEFHLPPADDEARWLAGAIRKAHVLGCNPGGEVASHRLDDLPDFAKHGPRYPRGKLLSKAEIEALEPKAD